MLEDKRWSTVRTCVVVMAGFIPGYSDTLTSGASKRRYSEKLRLVDGIDPYEVDKKVWEDDLDLWPAITHVHACMYLIVTPSPDTENDMLNYKSLDSTLLRDG